MRARGRPVEAYDKEGRLIGSWVSVFRATSETGFSKQAITNCARCADRGQCPMCSYFRRWRRTWRFAAPAE